MVKNIGPVQLRQKKYWVQDGKGEAVKGDIVAIEYAGGIVGKQGNQSVAFKLNEYLKRAVRAVHPQTGKLVTVPQGITPVRRDCYRHNQRMP